MENTQSRESSSMMYYVGGAILLVAVVAGGLFVRSKSMQNTTPQEEKTPMAETKTAKQITGLTCDTQYFNPKIGFPQYYLSVEGADLSDASSVECTFTASASGQVASTSEASGILADAPERNGKTFRCTTNAVELKPNVKTLVTVSLKDDMGRTGGCSASFTFPKQ